MPGGDHGVPTQYLLPGKAPPQPSTREQTLDITARGGCQQKPFERFGWRRFKFASQEPSI